MKPPYEKDYSVIVCTRDPDERLLTRCLKAIAGLRTDGLRTEVILADNSSKTPVRDLHYVKAQTKQLPAVQHLATTAPNLPLALAMAIEAAAGKFIVFAGYDNELAPGYLLALKDLNERFPQVGAWGPGELTVDFVDGIDGKIEDYARTAFLERHAAAMDFATERNWHPSYPVGNGLSAYAFLLKEYAKLMQQGAFTQSAALGNGENAQAVLHCIRKGFAAGSSPGLQLRHMVPHRHANRKHLQRLAWRTGMWHERCLLEVFPERRQQLLRRLMPEEKFSKLALKRTINTTWHRDPMKRFELVRFLSTHAGIYAALSKPLPVMISRIVQWLRLEPRPAG